MRLSGAWGAAWRRLVRREAVHALARERGVSVSDDELQAAVDAYRRARGLHGAERTRRWLAAEGLTLVDLERACEGELLEARLRDRLPASAVEALFEEERARYERFRLRIARVEGEEKARELVRQLEEGEPFEALAREHSVDRSAPLGAALGWRERHELPEALAEAVAGAEPGALLGPLPAEGAYAILRVEERRPAELTPDLARRLRGRLLDRDLARVLGRQAVAAGA